MDDAELIDAFIAGDERAFNSIVHKYRRKVYGYVRRMVGNHEDADDIAQETFVRAYKGLGRFRRSASLETWLIRIAINQTLNHLRRKKWLSAVSLGAIGEVVASHEKPADRATEESERRELVRRALEALPARQRTVFVLRFYDEKTFAEIGELTGTTSSAAKSNYHHAVGRMREVIAASGGFER